VSDADDVWTQVTLFLRSQLAESVWFSTFQEIIPLDAGTDMLRLLAPSAYVRDRILTRYLPLVTDALDEAGEGHRSIDIEVAKSDAVDDEPAPSQQNVLTTAPASFWTAETTRVAMSMRQG
jgi:chromosomal replication initiator protein